MERSAPKIGVPLLWLQSVFTASRTENTELVNGQVSSICQATVNCNSGKNSFYCEDSWIWEQVAQKGHWVYILSYMKLSWISLWANCCRWPCSEQGWDEAHSRGVALWFCGSVSSSEHSILTGLICVGYYIDSMSMSDDKRKFSSVLFSSITVTY